MSTPAYSIQPAATRAWLRVTSRISLAASWRRAIVLLRLTRRFTVSGLVNGRSGHEQSLDGLWVSLTTDGVNVLPVKSG